MKKYLLVFAILTALIFVMALSVCASDYVPAFGEPIAVNGIAEPSILDKTSRVLMSDGKTYPAYYILNDSDSFSPNFGKLNNALKALGQEAAYDRGTVIALEIPEGTINLPSCWSAGGFFQGDKYTPSIEYLRLPSTLVTMGDAAIYRITTLKLIDNFENTKVEAIPTRLQGLSSLQYIHLPNTVKTIPGNAFQGCTSVEYIILGASIEEINTQAFLYAGNNSGKNCLKLYVSDSLSSIVNQYGDGPLQGSHSVVVLYYTGTLTDVGMQQMITGTGIKKGASKWEFVDASAEGFDKNATYEKNTIIYNYNKCDAFYGGVHNVVEINECQIACEVCQRTELKENPVHINVLDKKMTGTGYFGDITVSEACKNCGKVERSEAISPMFVSIGYSACTFADGYSMTQGYKVDKKAIESYKAYFPNLEFGVLATVNKQTNGEEQTVIAPTLDSEDVYSSNLSNLNHDYFDIKVVGIKEANKDALVVFCAYVLDDGELLYLDNGALCNEIMGISYNGVVALSEE